MLGPYVASLKFARQHAMIFLAVLVCGAALGLLPASSQPAWAQADTLRVGTYGPPPGLGNPYKGGWRPGIYTWGAIFDRVTMVDAQGTAQPALATSWRNVNPNTWQFTLRQGVSFQNGEPFNAQAVAVTMAYLTSKEGNPPRGGRTFRGFSVKALDDYTLEVTTEKPNPIVPNVLAALHVFAPDAWTDLGDEDFTKSPVGSGPYRLVKWIGGQAVLEAFSGSWHAPAITHLEIIDLQEPAARLEALMSDQIDIMIGPAPDDIARIEAAGYAVFSGAASQTSMMALRYQGTNVHPALTDKRVRQALNYAVDKESMARELFHNMRPPSGQPSTPASFGYDPSINPYPYDTEKAKRLLAEAGYPDGFSIVVEFYGDEGDIYQQIAEDLAQVGVKAEVRSIVFQEAVKKAIGNLWEGNAFRSIFSVLPEMDAIRSVFNSSCLRAKPWFCGQEIMPLIEQANAEFDPDKRKALLQQILRWYHDEAPSIFLLDNPEINAINKRVQNFENINSVIQYHKMTLAD